MLIHIRICALISVLVVSHPLSGQSAPSVSSQKGTEQAHRQNQQQAAKQSLPVVTDVVSRDLPGNQERSKGNVIIAALKPIDVRADVPKDWMDKLGWFLSATLVLIGGLGVWYARKTLKVIEGQLAEIRAAGKQTDQMIQHAGEQAKAALRQSEIATNAERAWIIEEINFPTELPFQSEEAGALVATLVVFRIKNWGKTVARIRDAKLNFHRYPKTLTLAEPPEYAATNRLTELGEDGFLLAPGQQIALQIYLSGGSLSKEEAQKVRCGDLSLIAFGLFEYETLGSCHVSQFCYTWHEPMGLVTEADFRGLRRSGPPSYNRVT